LPTCFGEIIVDPSLTDNRADPEPSSISSTLLQRVKDSEPEAWDRLARLYGPLVYRWCRRRGLQSADAADIVQETFRAVAGGVAGFHREQPGDSFRSWLLTITLNKIRDHFRARQRRPGAVGGTDAQQQLAQVPDDAPSTVDSSPDDHAEAGLTHRAMEAVRNEFEESTWQCFWRMTVLGQTSTEIAEDLDMSKAAVRQAKCRVLSRLRQELQ